MSFWRFLGSWLAGALYSGWATADIVHRICLLVGGALVVLSAHAAAREGEPEMLIAAPLIVAVVVVAGSLVYHAYRLYKDEFNVRAQFQEWFTPKLEFAGIGEQTHGVHRARIRNLSAQSIWFVTRMIEIRPSIGIALPFVLKPTHRSGEETEAIGGQYATVDVFADSQGHWRLMPGSTYCPPY